MTASCPFLRSGGAPTIVSMVVTWSGPENCGDRGWGRKGGWNGPISSPRRAAGRGRGALSRIAPSGAGRGGSDGGARGLDVSTGTCWTRPGHSLSRGWRLFRTRLACMAISARCFAFSADPTRQQAKCRERAGSDPGSAQSWNLLGQFSARSKAPWRCRDGLSGGNSTVATVRTGPRQPGDCALCRCAVALRLPRCCASPADRARQSPGTDQAGPGPVGVERPGPYG